MRCKLFKFEKLSKVVSQELLRTKSVCTTNTFDLSCSCVFNEKHLFFNQELNKGNWFPFLCFLLFHFASMIFLFLRIIYAEIETYFYQNSTRKSFLNNHNSYRFLKQNVILYLIVSNKCHLVYSLVNKSIFT